MHLVVGGGQRLEVVRPQPVHLQLEGQGGLQVPVDPVLREQVPRAVREVARKLVVEQHDERHATHQALRWAGGRDM